MWLATGPGSFNSITLAVAGSVGFPQLCRECQRDASVFRAVAQSLYVLRYPVPIHAQIILYSTSSTGVADNASTNTSHLGGLVLA